MSFMGELTFFLGLQVKQLPEGIFISQDKFQVTPKASHLNAVKRIFRYLKHQPKLGLWYPRDSPFELEAYSNSDYGGASIDRKSTTGGCQFLGRRLISWQCKKQTIMANSTTEAEYVAAANYCGQDKHGFEDGQKLGCKFFLFMVSYEEKIRVLQRDLENTSNELKYSKKINAEIKMEKQDLQAKLDNSLSRFNKWKESSKNLAKLIDNTMSVKSKLGLGYKDYTGPNEIYYPEMQSIFDPEEADDKTLYYQEHVRFVKEGGMNAVPPPITGIFMPSSNQPDIEESKMTLCKLQLVDATGIHNLSDVEIYAGLATLRYVTEAEPHHTPVDPITSTSYSPYPSPPHPSPLHQSPPHSLPHSPPYSPPHSPPQSPPHLLPPWSYETPLPEGTKLGSAEDSMQLKELMVLVPTLVTRINSLEKELKETKHTLGNVMLKLVKKVKSLEKALKRKSKKRIHEREVNRFCYAYKSFRGGYIKESTIPQSPLAWKRGQREGKAQWFEEESQATYKTQEQMNTREEEAGLEEAIKLQAQLDEEVAKQIHLDKMIAKRMAEEEALTKQQKKRKDSESRNLEAFSVKEVKEEFDKLVQQIDTFVPINLEATKAKLKRYGEELQTKTSKKQRTGKRKKQKARKGVNVDKNAQEDSETDKDESVEAMNPTPLTTKSDSVVNWKIFQQGRRSVYQIIRADGHVGRVGCFTKFSKRGLIHFCRADGFCI
ncbi:hypothetical protein Tco_1049934 [Tanacetum coccineum]